MNNKTIEYTTDSTGKCFVFAGKQIIAMSYCNLNGGYSVRILQGMDRSKTIKKICIDCPEFAEANNINENTYPYLFSMNVAKKMMNKQ